jgi:NADH dehydrogenase
MLPAMNTLNSGHTQTVILGGGFGGATVARLLGKRGATIINPDSAMVYTPVLPEVAAGALEARHAVVPLRMMCPHAAVVRGRAVSLDADARRVGVETEFGRVDLAFERLVVALGSVPRVPPVPGLAERGLQLKGIRDAIQLRDHVLRQLDRAVADRRGAERYLTFVFVGAGFAGVEALAELNELVQDAVRYYPELRGLPQRWVLVDGGSKLLAEVPRRLGAYTEKLLRRRGVELRLGTTIGSVERDAVTLSDGTRVETETLVWTAGVAANPILAALGLPLDDRGRVIVDSSLKVRGRDDIWALGDCARVPNAANPDVPDPPTCQHALRQAQRLAKSLVGRGRRPYRYRSLGQGAVLGRDKGIANVFGLKLKGVLAAAIIRAYHVRQLPLFTRRVRLFADGMVTKFIRRDIAELGMR